MKIRIHVSTYSKSNFELGSGRGTEQHCETIRIFKIGLRDEISLALAGQQLNSKYGRFSIILRIKKKLQPIRLNKQATLLLS